MNSENKDSIATIPMTKVETVSKSKPIKLNKAEKAAENIENKAVAKALSKEKALINPSP